MVAAAPYTAMSLPETDTSLSGPDTSPVSPSPSDTSPVSPLPSDTSPVSPLPLFSPLFAQQLAQTASGSAQLLLAAQQSEMPSRWRLIPYRAVGQQGMLLGFRPDWVILQHGKEYRRYSNVIVALSEQKFSAYETYQGLVPPELL